MTPTNNIEASRTQLHAMRALMPARSLSFHEALQRAELQAARLLELCTITDGPVPESIITGQPRITVESSYVLGESGRSTWDRGAWRVQLNALEPEVRRRFTLAHEYKHIIDAPVEQQSYDRLRGSGEHHSLIEQVCDYFAACLLMPKMLFKRVWGEGLHDTRELAGYFDVSPQAMHIRLQTLGLIEQPGRCGTPTNLIRQQTPAPAIRPRICLRTATAAVAGVTP